MKRQLYLIICLTLPTLVFGQNEIKSPEDRKVLKESKVNIEKLYYTDSLKTFKKLVSIIEYNKNGDIIKYESNYLNHNATSKIFFEFDSQYRLRKKTLCLDSLCNHHTIEEYDGKGHIVKLFSYDQSGNFMSSVDIKYNDKGYKTEESTTYPPSAISKNVYSYDNKDSLIQIVSKDKDGKITYDSKAQKLGDNYFDNTPILTSNKTKENKTFYTNGKIKSIEKFDERNNLIQKELFQYDSKDNNTIYEIEDYNAGLLTNKTIIKNNYNKESLITSRQIFESGYWTTMMFEYEFFK